MKVSEQVPVSADRSSHCKEHRAKGPKPEYGCRRSQQNYLDVTVLVQSVQRAEGHTDCFRRGFRDCDQPDCPWRKQCFQKG